VKTIVGFFSGVIVCGLLLLGLISAIPIQAQVDGSENTTDNFSLVELLPDLEKIYHEALMSPLNDAKSKIYDEDVAQYYERLLERTDLNRVEEGTE